MMLAVKILETESLKLIACDQITLQKAIEGTRQLEQHLNVRVHPKWTKFGERPLRYSLEKTMTEDEVGWWTYFPVHKADNTLIGTCGYKGKPDETGTVEIGYEITKDYQHRGYATELGRALVKNAFSFQQVNSIIAHTLADHNASTKVLSKCGFLKVNEIKNSGDALLWKWELKRIKCTMESPHTRG
jgi:ribosomal-protein-alanine N-acetyltransferase